MQRNFLLPILLFTALISLALQCKRTPPEPMVPPTAPGVTGIPSQFSDLSFVEFTTGPSSDGDLPLVIVIHGLGDTPENLGTLFVDTPFSARFLLPRGPGRFGWGHAWFDIRVPQRAEAIPRMAPAVARAADALCTFIASHSPTRPVIVTGFSQGAILSFATAVRCPSAVRLAIPIAGLLPAPLIPSDAPDSVRYPPIRALHGDMDSLIPLAFGRATVDALAAEGLDATLQIFAQTDHEITGAMQAYIFRQLADYLK